MSFFPSKRFIILLTTLTSTIAVVTSALIDTAPRLLWNATASVPVGLYFLQDISQPTEQFKAGELVALRLPESVSRFMVQRKYIAPGLPVFKHIAAVSGQVVCRINHTIFIDANPTASTLSSDSKGRGLPVWHGCKELSKGEVFLMNATITDSFDGRYYGAIPASSIIGKPIPIFTIGQPGMNNPDLAWRANRIEEK